MEILNLTEDTVTIATVAAALENLAEHIPAGMALIRIKPISSLRHGSDGTGKVEWYLLAVFRSAGSEDLDADHQIGDLPA